MCNHLAFRSDCLTWTVVRFRGLGCVNDYTTIWAMLMPEAGHPFAHVCFVTLLSHDASHTWWQGVSPSPRNQTEKQAPSSTCNLEGYSFCHGASKADVCQTLSECCTLAADVRVETNVESIYEMIRSKSRCELTLLLDRLNAPLILPFDA